MEEEVKTVQQEYKLPEHTVNQILDYLGNKPYKEVSHLIADIYKNAKKL